MPPQQLSLSSQTVALLCWCQVCSILAFCAWVSESNLLTGHPQQKWMQLYIPSSARVKLKQIGHEKKDITGRKVGDLSWQNKCWACCTPLASRETSCKSGCLHRYCNSRGTQHTPAPLLLSSKTLQKDQESMRPCWRLKTKMIYWFIVKKSET